MPYNPNIPQPNDTLDVSQGDILGNFQSADTSFGINHYNFSDLTSNNGKHKFVNIPNFTPSGSVPTNVASEGVVYTDVTGGVTPHTQLFFNRDTEGVGRRVQLTSGTLSGSNNTSFGENGSINGWTCLPGNLILQYGISSISSGNITVNFPIPFKATTQPISVSVTKSHPTSPPGSTFGDYYVSTTPADLTNTSFKIVQNNETHSYSFYWMAIGIAE